MQDTKVSMWVPEVGRVDVASPGPGKVSMWVPGAGKEYSCVSKSKDLAMRNIARKFGCHAKRMWIQTGDIVGSNSNGIIREGLIVHNAQVLCKILYMVS